MAGAGAGAGQGQGRAGGGGKDPASPPSQPILLAKLPGPQDTWDHSLRPGCTSQSPDPPDPTSDVDLTGPRRGRHGEDPLV